VNSAARARRRPSLGSGGGSVLLAGVLFLPALVFYFGWATSLALGTTLTASVLVGAAALQRGPGLNAPSAPRVAAIVLTAVTIHSLLGCLFQPFDVWRALSSLAPLVVLILGGNAWARLLSSASPRTLDRIIARCFALMMMVALLAALDVTVSQPDGQGTYNKPLFPFTEPSHFALLFTPLLLYTCVVASGRRRLFVLLLGTLVALILQNLTLVVGLVVVTSVCLSRRVLPLLLIAGLAILQMDLSYYSDRLDFSGDIQNLSNLVYVQGWQLMYESLSQSNGWGLGFQQLGVQGSNTSASQIIFTLLGGDYANILDGGFTMSKVISEFGIFGLGLIGVYLVVAWSAWRTLRLASQQPGSLHALDVFAYSVIVGYVVELLVRGTGYFTGTAILLCAALWLRYSRRGLRLSHQSTHARSSRARRVWSVICRPAPTATPLPPP